MQTTAPATPLDFNLSLKPEVSEKSLSPRYFFFSTMAIPKCGFFFFHTTRTHTWAHPLFGFHCCSHIRVVSSPFQFLPFYVFVSVCVRLCFSQNRVLHADNRLPWWQPCYSHKCVCETHTHTKTKRQTSVPTTLLYEDTIQRIKKMEMNCSFTLRIDFVILSNHFLS